MDLVVSEAIGTISNRLFHIENDPEVIKQDPKLVAAINALSMAYHSVNNRENNKLPQRTLTFDEVSQMFGGVEKKRDIELESATKVPSVEIKNKILEKIEKILAEVNLYAEEGKIPKLEVRNQKLWSNCIYDLGRVTLKSVLDAKKASVVYSANRDKTKFNAIIFVLTKVHEMITRNVTCTRRELYYQNVSRLKNQSAVDSAVRDVCCLLETPPWELGVTATAKGLIAGPLTLVTKNGMQIDCMKNEGVLVPQDIVNLKTLKSSAKYILVVEKDAIFQKLLDEGALKRLGPVIIITGKGYPDICTRQLLVRLVNELRIPSFAIVDYDPHGLEIFLTYKFGSLAQSHISESLCTNSIRLVGIQGRDVRSLARTTDKAPLTERDKNKLKSLIERPYLQHPQHEKVLQEIQRMQQEGIKAEIESMATLSPAYLTDSYIPMKIIEEDFL